VSEVPRVRTRVTPDEASAAISRAWQERFGSPIAPDVLALLLGLWDLETATGGSQFNFNFGNIITTTDSVPWFAMLDSGNPRKFRSFATIDDGAANFVNQLTRDTRPQWRDGLLRGEPVEFVRGLKGLNGGPEYFEAPFDRYLSGYLTRWRRYRPEGFDVDGRRVSGAPEGPPEASTGASTGVTAGVVSLATGALIWLIRRLL